jgi:sulfate permease, SulP family
MRMVPIIDATGIRTLESVLHENRHRHTKLILAEVHSAQVLEELKKSRMMFAIGKANITTSMQAALERANVILKEIQAHRSSTHQ